MTPLEEFEFIVERVRTWPPAHPDRDMQTLVLASKRAVDDPLMCEAFRIVYLRHLLSWLIRPATWALFAHLDAQLQRDA
jgi:hypothetical protein